MKRMPTFIVEMCIVTELRALKKHRPTVYAPGRYGSLVRQALAGCYVASTPWTALDVAYRNAGR